MSSSIFSSYIWTSRWRSGSIWSTSSSSALAPLELNRVAKWNRYYIKQKSCANSPLLVWTCIIFLRVNRRRCDVIEMSRISERARHFRVAQFVLRLMDRWAIECARMSRTRLEHVIIHRHFHHRRRNLTGWRLQIIGGVLANSWDGIAIARLWTLVGWAQRSFEQSQLDNFTRKLQNFTVFHLEISTSGSEQLLQSSQMLLCALRGRQIVVARLTRIIRAMHNILHLTTAEGCAIARKIGMIAARRCHRWVAVQWVEIIVDDAVGCDGRCLWTAALTAGRDRARR